jgi:hypothetical protein
MPLLAERQVTVYPSIIVAQTLTKEARAMRQNAKQVGTTLNKHQVKRFGKQSLRLGRGRRRILKAAPLAQDNGRLLSPQPRILHDLGSVNDAVQTRQLGPNKQNKHKQNKKKTNTPSKKHTPPSQEYLSQDKPRFPTMPISMRQSKTQFKKYKKMNPIVHKLFYKSTDLVDVSLKTFDRYLKRAIKELDTKRRTRRNNPSSTPKQHSPKQVLTATSKRARRSIERNLQDKTPHPLRTKQLLKDLIVSYLCETFVHDDPVLGRDFVVKQNQGTHDRPKQQNLFYDDTIDSISRRLSPANTPARVQDQDQPERTSFSKPQRPIYDGQRTDGSPILSTDINPAGSIQNFPLARPTCSSVWTPIRPDCLHTPVQTMSPKYTGSIPQKGSRPSPSTPHRVENLQYATCHMVRVHHTSPDVSDAPRQVTPLTTGPQTSAISDTSIPSGTHPDVTRDSSPGFTKSQVSNVTNPDVQISAIAKSTPPKPSLMDLDSPDFTSTAKSPPLASEEGMNTHQTNPLLH